MNIDACNLGLVAVDCIQMGPLRNKKLLFGKSKVVHQDKDFIPTTLNLAPLLSQDSMQPGEAIFIVPLDIIVMRLETMVSGHCRTETFQASWKRSDIPFCAVFQYDFTTRETSASFHIPVWEVRLERMVSTHSHVYSSKS
jgi:hypothetical protein